MTLVLAGGWLADGGAAAACFGLLFAPPAGAHTRQPAFARLLTPSLLLPSSPASTQVIVVAPGDDFKKGAKLFEALVKASERTKGKVRGSGAQGGGG